MGGEERDEGSPEAAAVALGKQRRQRGSGTASQGRRTARCQLGLRWRGEELGQGGGSRRGWIWLVVV